MLLRSFVRQASAILMIIKPPSLSTRKPKMGKRFRPLDAAQKSLKRQLGEFSAASKILFESVRAREGFFVCELANHSDKAAYVYIQLNKSGFYGGSGLIGVAIKIVASFIRLSHLSFGH